MTRRCPHGDAWDDATRPSAGAETQWRSWLRRKIGWLLFAKLVALILLWSVSFSREHRLEVTPGRMDALLALDGGPAGPAAAPGESADD